MQIFYDLEIPSEFCQACIMTVGVFDGLHIGHQAVIQQVLAQAEKSNLPSLVLAFHPPPLAFLAPEKCPPTLTVLPKKIEILRQLGVDIAVLAPFNAHLQRLSPDEFVQQILLRQFHARQVIVGYDWQFGRARTGNTEVLRRLGRQHQFDVTIVGPAQLDGSPVHSTRIRQAIADGDLELAAQLLGRRYSIIGEVIAGDGRGRAIGYPTVNIDAGTQMLPPNGVYAMRAKLEGRTFDGVLNMGTRPTFDGVKFQIEGHLFRFEEMVYGKEMEICFVEKIRDERTFPNSEALANQIKQDVATASTILGRTKF